MKREKNVQRTAEYSGSQPRTMSGMMVVYLRVTCVSADYECDWTIIRQGLRDHSRASEHA